MRCSGVQLSVHLIDTQRGAVLWAQDLDEAVGDVLTLQEVIAGQVARQLLPQLAPDAAPHARNRTSTEVQELYLKGRFHYNQRTAEDMRQAAADFEQAVAKDAEAEARFRRSIEIGPGNSLTKMRYGIGLTSRGLFDAGIQQLREGRRLDPLSRPLGSPLLRSLFMARRFEEAVKDAQPVIDADPNHAEPHLWRGLSLVYLGSPVEGLAAIERAVSLAPRNPGPLAGLGWAQARLGRRAAALETLARLRRGLGSAPISPYLLAEVYAGLGDEERAVAEVLAAKREHTAYIPLRLAVDPRMEPIRKDPRIQALLHELGLEGPGKPMAGTASSPG